MPSKESGRPSILDIVQNRQNQKKTIVVPSSPDTPKKKAEKLQEEQLQQLEQVLLFSEGMTAREIADKLRITESQVKGHMNTVGPYLIGEQDGRIWIKNQTGLRNKVRELRRARVPSTKRMSTDTCTTLSDNEIIRRLHTDRDEE
ncbi:MAG: helix-turn-helix transcriptional regulator [Candidatus Woesebacteria bacterium]